MGLVSQFDETHGTGIALVISADGKVRARLGTTISAAEKKPSELISRSSLTANRWHHVAVLWNGHEASVWIDGNAAAEGPVEGELVLPNAPLRLATGPGSEVNQFLDGDLAMPVFYGRALTQKEVHERHREQALKQPVDRSVLACWPLAEERGDRIEDVSDHDRHGRVINHGTWMIGGPSFQAEVLRYGDYDPVKDSKRGHGLRFASDDLYDCRWQPTHRFRVPPDAKPGIYVGRVRFEIENKPSLYHVTFIVRKPRRRKPAPILVLCATNTWKAYSGTPFGKNLPDLKQVWGTNGIENNVGDPPAYCFYRPHAAGQGTFQLGFRMPWPVASPYVLYGGKTDYSHLCRADRFLQVWLEQSGYDFDVVSDHDLHRDPKMLRDYPVFVINGHSEYWSLPMYGGLEDYLKRGGNVVCLSGNSLFWRVSYNEDGSVIECRKVDAPGDQLPHERRGECWHSHDGERGGMLRECGYPGWRLIGLDTLGWNNQGDARQFGPFLVELPDHFLFNQPERVGLKSGEAIGQAPDGGLPRANGHEIDVRLSTLAALQEQPTPPGATLPSDPAGMNRLANGVVPWKFGGTAFDYFFRPLKPKVDQGGEMIYWERSDGGRVFNAGSIGSGWGLLADPRFQALLRNVLHHLGVKQPR
jgi:hypothetical protein